MADPNLKIRIATEAELSGIKQAEAGLKDLSDEAKQTANEIANAVKQGIGLPDVRRQADDLAAGSSAPPPDQDGGLSRRGAAIASAAAIASVAGLAAATRALIGNLSEGAESAVELAKELDGLDESARRAATAGMGPLGELIAANSPALLQFASDVEQIQKNFDGLWTAAGARLVPALNEVTSALASIDTTAFGAQIGDAVGGAIRYMTELAYVLNGVLDGFTGSASGAEIFALRISQMIPGVQQVAALLDKLAEKNRQYQADQANADGFASGEASRFDRLSSLAESLANIRTAGAEKLLSIEQQITAIHERRDQAITDASTLSGKAAEDAAKQAEALERQLQALEVRKQNEEEAARAKEDQLQASRDDLALRTRLNEAIAQGNEEEQKRLRWLQDFQAAMSQSGNNQVAARAAADQAQAVRDLREAEADRKQADSDRIADLREQLALLKEQQQTAQQALQAQLEHEKAVRERHIAGMQARDDSEAAVNKARLDNIHQTSDGEQRLQQLRMQGTERVRELELEIAGIRGDAESVQALQAEDRKQEQIALTQLKQQEADAAAEQLASERGITAEQNARNKHVRGPFESAAHAEQIGADVSGLDRWHNLQGGPPIVPPATPPPAPVQPPPPPAATTPQQPGQPGQPGQQADTSAIQQALQAAQQQLQQVIQAAVDAIKGAFSGIGDLFAGLKDAITGAGDKQAAELRAATQAVNALTSSLIPLIQGLKQELEALKARVDNLRSR